MWLSFYTLLKQPNVSCWTFVLPHIYFLLVLQISPRWLAVWTSPTTRSGHGPQTGAAGWNDIWFCLTLLGSHAGTMCHYSHLCPAWGGGEEGLRLHLRQLSAFCSNFHHRPPDGGYGTPLNYLISGVSATPVLLLLSFLLGFNLFETYKPSNPFDMNLHQQRGLLFSSKVKAIVSVLTTICVENIFTSFEENSWSSKVRWA